ncbi:MAG TPA: hypothetical protein VN861_16410 [Candidatus Acidoferrales bacterium]|nr:hypothetical protein [Candidatus Acidoferrales bacterium]
MDTATRAAEVHRRRIPQAMWNEIFRAEGTRSFLNLRDELIRIGLKHGFGESELERRGVITVRSRAKKYFEAGA